MKGLILLTTLVLTFNVSINASEPKEAITRTIISSPPIVYGDTIDLGSFNIGSDMWKGCAIENLSGKTLELDKVICSVSDLKCTVRLNKVTPLMKVGVWVFPKFKKPVGIFNAEILIYWKGIQEPTKLYVSGNCKR